MSYLVLGASPELELARRLCTAAGLMLPRAGLVAPGTKHGILADGETVQHLAGACGGTGRMFRGLRLPLVVVAAAGASDHAIRHLLDAGAIVVTFEHLDTLPVVLRRLSGEAGGQPG